MKTFLKINVAILFAMLLGIYFRISATNWDDPSYGNVSLESETTKTTVLEDDISKKEVINVLKYSYPNHEKLTNYKYITWKSVITYFNNVTKEILAFATVECNFRYNSVLKKCECLSSTFDKICENNFYSLGVFSRRKNNRLDLGGNAVEIKFKNNGKTYEENNYNVECDYLGNINIV